MLALHNDTRCTCRVLLRAALFRTYEHPAMLYRRNLLWSRSRECGTGSGRAFTRGPAIERAGDRDRTFRDRFLPARTRRLLQRAGTRGLDVPAAGRARLLGLISHR